MKLEKWNEELRYQYDLNENSIVVDAGGYKGDFTRRIYNTFNCNIYVFEPVNRFYKNIENEFKNNPKVHTYNEGMLDKDSEEVIYVKGNFGESSTFFEVSGDKEIIKMKDVASFIKENDIKNVDLFKINIEGGEYPLLFKMIKDGLIEKCDNLQIQFHNFVDNCDEMRNEIREELSKTHYVTYEIDYVWENWKRK